MELTIFESLVSYNHPNCCSSFDVLLTADKTKFQFFKLSIKLLFIEDKSYQAGLNKYALHHQMFEIAALETLTGMEILSKCSTLR